MARLSVFNSVSLDGYFTDAHGDMSWAHRSDPQWRRFTSGNAKGTAGILVFGRVTYDQMKSFWPTDAAKEAMPTVAKAMNAAEKLVFSKTLRGSDWENTTVEGTDPAAEIRRRKKGRKDLLIMGSGTIVAQLAQAGLIDQLTLVVVPIVLGAGRTLFEGAGRAEWKLTGSRKFKNGNVVDSYVRG